METMPSGSSSRKKNRPNAPAARRTHQAVGLAALNFCLSNLTHSTPLDTLKARSEAGPSAQGTTNNIVSTWTILHSGAKSPCSGFSDSPLASTSPPFPTELHIPKFSGPHLKVRTLNSSISSASFHVALVVAVLKRHTSVHSPVYIELISLRISRIIGVRNRARTRYTGPGKVRSG